MTRFSSTRFLMFYGVNLSLLVVVFAYGQQSFIEEDFAGLSTVAATFREFKF